MAAQLPGSKMATSIECAVVGTGPTGLAAALALAAAGAEVALIGPRPKPAGGRDETRTAALFPGSLNLLRNLGAWSAAAETGAPIAAIRLIDDTGRLLRAPEVLFEARDIGRDSFGCNVPNDALVAELAARISSPGGPAWIETAKVAAVEADSDLVRLHLAEGGTFETRLLVAADGRNSICRTAAAISTRSWTSNQTALVAGFAHARPHHGISTEFHRSAGPLTTVPLPGRTSSLVWVERPQTAERLGVLNDAEFAAALETRLQGLLGPVERTGPRRLYPLSGHVADRFARNRAMLVGEAGHGLPPIGAQGLNLGLRDVAVLAETVADARAKGQDIGSAAVLDAYHARRVPDVALRTWGVDFLNKTLISGLLPVHLARGAGLHLLKAIAPLRRLVMRQGLTAPGPEPRLMRRPDNRSLSSSAARLETAL
ncbi:MAG: FAD-dependent oxidoreductase [Hyphomicrobiaceae bacterium]